MLNEPADVKRLKKALGFLELVKKELESIEDDALKNDQTVTGIIQKIAAAPPLLKALVSANIKRLFDDEP